MPNPSEALAVHILDRLVDEGLLQPADARAVLPKFAAGTLTAEDWRVYVGRAAAGGAPAGGAGPAA